MTLTAPDAPCACRSGRLTDQCCIPASFPVANLETGLKRVRVTMSGLDNFGRRITIPTDVFATFGLKNPSQVDEVVSATLQPWYEALETKVIDLGFEAAMASDGHKVCQLLSNLEDSLTATRYHQRQFLCRFRSLGHQHSFARTRGHEQLQVILADVPLRCEMEAFLVRTSGSLDAVAQVLGLLLTGKPHKFGGMVQVLEKNRNSVTPLRAKLKELIREHKVWIDLAKNYRHAIVHEAEFGDFQGPKFGPDGISVAAVVNDDASDFTICTWRQLRQLMHSIAETMSREQAEWRLTQSS